MPLPEEDLLEKHFPDDENGRNGAKSVFGIIAIALVIIFIVGIGMFYFMAGKAPDPENLPTITEDNPPERTKPDDPGGMDIPHQDTTVYDRVTAPTNENEPEKLLPAPEEPVEQTSRPADQQTSEMPVSSAEEAPEKLNNTPETQPADIPTELKGLPEAAEQTSRPADQQTSENPAAPSVVGETKATAPSEVTEQKGVEVTPQPKAAETATTDFRIQLGAVKDEALAKTEWARIQKKSPDALQGLEPFYSPVNLGDKGNYLRIQTSTLSRGDAEARCTKLKTVNQACLIVRAVK